MKYEIFAVALLVGVPLLALAAVAWPQARGWLLTLLVVSTALGDEASINFVSMESYRGPDRGFEVTLTDLVALALAAALVVRHPRRLVWWPYNTAWMVGLFLVGCFTALLASDPLLSTFTLVKMVRLYVVYWCVVNCLQAGVGRLHIWRGLAGIGLLLTVLTIQQKYLQGVMRVTGPFDHSNTVPSFLMLVIPLLLVWALCDRDLSLRQVGVSLLSVLGMLLAIVSTLSRAGMGLAILGVLGGLFVANVMGRTRRAWFISLGIGLILLAGAAKAADTVLERFRDAPEASATARREFNRSAALMLERYPLGVGLNNFSRVLTAEPDLRAHFVAMVNEDPAGVVHHIYWLMLAETGHLGLALFLIVQVRFAWVALREGVRGRTLEALLLLGLFIGFAATAAVGLLEWTLRISPVAYLYMVSAGVVAAWGHRCRVLRPAPLVVRRAASVPMVVAEAA
ncbi:MAG: O-antigen ligase family protein [Candidatus Latescibacterota bacterium]